MFILFYKYEPGFHSLIETETRSVLIRGWALINIFSHQGDPFN